MHCPLLTAQKQMPSALFDSYYKFAFVRNPWGRLVSEYNAAIKKNRRARHRKIAAMGSFSAYVDYEIRRNKLQQHAMLVDEKGTFAMDKIGRFESLVDDYNSICDQIGLDTHLNKLNAFPHADYRSFYNTPTRDKVAKHWEKDIALFSYQF